MVTERKASLDSTLSHYATLADEERVTRAAVALEENEIGVLRATDGGEARRIVLDLIPEGAQVHHGASVSLEASGIVGEIESSGRYDSLKPRIWSMDRAAEADEIRRLSAAPDVMLGSVHAVTEGGALVTASASGSQLGLTPRVPGRSSSLSGRRRSSPTSTRRSAASWSTPTRSRTRVPRRRTACTAG